MVLLSLDQRDGCNNYSQTKQTRDSLRTLRNSPTQDDYCWWYSVGWPMSLDCWRLHTLEQNKTTEIHYNDVDVDWYSFTTNILFYLHFACIHIASLLWQQMDTSLRRLKHIIIASALSAANIALYRNMNVRPVSVQLTSHFEQPRESVQGTDPIAPPVGRDSVCVTPQVCESTISFSLGVGLTWSHQATSFGGRLPVRTSVVHWKTKTGTYIVNSQQYTSSTTTITGGTYIVKSPQYTSSTNLITGESI